MKPTKEELDEAIEYINELFTGLTPTHCLEKCLSILTKYRDGELVEKELKNNTQECNCSWCKERRHLIAMGLTNQTGNQ